MIHDEKKMGTILYHLGHYGFFFRYLLHKESNHPNEPALFIVEAGGMDNSAVEFLQRKEGILKKQGVSLIIYDELPYVRKNTKDLKDEVFSFFNTLLDNRGYDLDSFSEFHSGYDWMKLFTAYLLFNGKKINLWDLYNNTVSDVNRLVSAAANKIYKGVDHSNKNVLKIYTNDLIHPSKPKSVYYDIQYELKKIDVKRIGSYYELFDIPSIEGEFDLVALESSLGLFEPIGDYEYLHRYLCLANYCGLNSNRLLVKAHPKTTFNEDKVKSVFPNSTYISGFVPIEILCHLPNVVINNALILTPSIRLEAKNIIVMPGLKAYLNETHLYYAIGKLCEKLKLKIEFDNKYSKEQWTRLIGYASPMNDSYADTIKIKKTTSFDDESESFILINPLEWFTDKSLYDKSTLFEVRLSGGISTVNHILVRCPGKKMPKELNYTLDEGHELTIVRVTPAKAFEKSPAIVSVSKVLKNTIVAHNQSLNEKELLYSLYRDLPTAEKIAMVDSIMSKKVKGLYAFALDIITYNSMLKPLIDDSYDNIDVDKLDKYISLGTSSLNEAKLMFDLYWTSNNSSDHDKMIRIIRPFSDAGHGVAIGRMGRAYRDGKGVPKDLQKAEELFAEASKKGVKWASNELEKLRNGNK